MEEPASPPIILDPAPSVHRHPSLAPPGVWEGLVERARLRSAGLACPPWPPGGGGRSGGVGAEGGARESGGRGGEEVRRLEELFDVKFLDIPETSLIGGRQVIYIIFALF